MATFTKYYDTVLQYWQAVHNYATAGNQFKAVIHSDAPVVATDDELADLTQITGTGYTAGGDDIQNDVSQATGTATATAVDVVWTAGAADWASGRYVSIHNEDSTTDKLICSYDYGSTFTVGNGETFTLDFGASFATLT